MFTCKYISTCLNIFKYIHVYLHINIYPRGGRFTGNSCPKGVYIYIYMKLLHGWCYASMGWGWGGDDNVPCTCTHGRCYASNGMGWGWQRSLHLHTWSVLRNIMFLALAHMVVVGATQVMGWGGVGVGMITFLSTCTHGRCYATSCSLHLHTWSVLRK